MANRRLAIVGVACFVFSVLFYSASRLMSSSPQEIWGSEAKSYSDEFQGYTFRSIRTQSHEEAVRLMQTAHNATSNTSTKATTPAATPVSTPASTLVPSRSSEYSEAEKIVDESIIKLEYALNSTDTNFEDAHLFSFGRYVRTFTEYLLALLSDPSIDQSTFHDLRQQFFPWWTPMADKAYLPWGPEPTAPKTGIVLTAGQGNFLLAAHCVSTLHNVVKSKLPIQVYYAGDEDLPEAKREQLKAMHPQLSTIDIMDLQFNETIAGLTKSGYAMKPFGALASSFQQVVLIDADTIFMQRPDSYFDDHPGLKETGLHYFHDRAYGGRKTTDWVQSLLRGAQPSMTLKESMFWQYELEHQQESGVVFFDKGIPSAFMSLLFTCYMNTRRIREDVIYNEVAGMCITGARQPCQC